MAVGSLFTIPCPPDSTYIDMNANTSQDHILIVDDDREIRTLLASYLEKQGARCTLASNGREMREALQENRIDLIVLDLMLPGEDGLTLCRNLRGMAGREANIPILMLTARGDDMDRILGLEMGADDYVSKPFIPRELYARIRAILRRTRSLPPSMGADALPAAKMLRFDHWLLDTTARHLVDEAGAIVALSGAEYRMLAVFLAHPHRILNRDQLMELTQGREVDVFDRSIDLLVSRVRTRLGDNAREPRIIKTVRSEGYILATDVTEVERTA